MLTHFLLCCLVLTRLPRLPQQHGQEPVHSFFIEGASQVTSLIPFVELKKYWDEDNFKKKMWGSFGVFFFFCIRSRFFFGHISYFSRVFSDFTLSQLGRCPGSYCNSVMFLGTTWHWWGLLMHQRASVSCPSSSVHFLFTAVKAIYILGSLPTLPSLSLLSCCGSRTRYLAFLSVCWL